MFKFIIRAFLKSLNNARYPAAANIFTISLKLSNYIFFIKYSNACHMLFQTNPPPPNVQSANIPYLMQLKLFFKKEYVCKIPLRSLKHFRHILHKANDLAHLSYQVTDVTASDIKKNCDKAADLSYKQ